MPDLRVSIKTALQAFATKPPRDAAISLLGTLGYQGDRTLVLDGSKPKAFLDLIDSQGSSARFDQTKALFSDWKSADILFQLTDEDLSATSSLFKETHIQPGLLRSYLYFAIELNGNQAVNGAYARGKLSAIARQINRVFPMPVMVFLKHGGRLSIAVINRRQNKLHADKDVLEKVTIIREVSLTTPHRGHLDILASFALGTAKRFIDHNEVLPTKEFLGLADALRAARNKVLTGFPTEFYEKIVRNTPDQHRARLVATGDDDLDSDQSLDPATRGRLKTNRNRLRRLLGEQQIERLRQIKLIDDILACTERVLNPAAHSGTPPLYEAEIQHALTLVRQLESVLIS